MIELYNDDCLRLNFGQYKNVVIVTDPPFNMKYHYDFCNDNMEESEYFEMLSVLLEGVPAVVIHYPEMLYKLSFQMGEFPERVISWVYNSNTPRQHRDIAFFNIKPDFTQVYQPYKNPNDKRVKALMAKGHKGAKLYDWWNVNQVKNVSKEKTAHPCQMPLEVMKNVVGLLPKDATIVDPFMGSGTTGVAVVEMNKEQKANRSFVGVEISKQYYEIARKRIKEE